jgi:hypothetical protein
MRPAIALADAACVLEGFGADDHDRALQMLGLGVEHGVPLPAKESRRDAVRPKREPPPGEVVIDPPVSLSGSGAPVRNDVLVFRDAAAAAAPAWLSATSALPVESNANLPLPALDPLFTPAWQRSIAVTALSGRVASGEIDVDRIVDRLAAGGPIDRLPLLSRRSLQAGAQIVLDASESMRPFFGDQQQTVAVVRTLFAPERLTVVVCDGPPAFGSGGTEPYEAPPPGATVLILSNFGITTGRTAVVGGDTTGWRAFAAELRRQRHAVLAFAPMDLRRLPASFRRALPVAAWDRATGTGSIVRARAVAEIAG